MADPPDRGAAGLRVSPDSVAQAAIFWTLLSGALPGLMLEFVGVSWHGRSSLLLTAACLFAWAVTMLHGIPASTVRGLLRGLPLLAFGGLAVLSTSWSPTPLTTFMAAILMSAVILNGVLAGTIFSWRAMVLGLVWATLALSFVSLAMIPFGGLMTDDYAGALKGPWPEKNEAGSVFALGAVAAGLAYRFERRARWIAIAFWLLATIVLTQSATSLAAAVLGLLVIVIVSVMGAGPKRLVLGIWVFALVGASALVLVLTRFDLVLHLLGRDATLTGRAAIWSSLLRRAMEQPLLGYGYGTWWSPDNPDRAWLYRELDFAVYSAHNSALEILLSVGLAGLVLMGLSLLLMLWAGVSRLGDTASPQRYVLAFLATLLVMSITESVLTGPEGLSLTVTAALLGRVYIGRSAAPAAG